MSVQETRLEWPVPPGYQALRPFDRERHGSMGISQPARRSLAAGTNAFVLTAPEFFQAARYYPIAFTRVGDNEDLHSVVVTSFLAQQNRFVDDEGTWRQGYYVPAYVRRYPFHAIPVQREGQEPDFLVCVDEAGLDPDAPPLFGADGEPSEEWTRMEQLIRDMEVARRQTQRLLSAIDELDVLESFEAQGVEDGGRALRLGNLLRVNESKLNELPGGTIKALVTVGALSRVYAHLMSLDNFAFLLEREVADRGV